MRYLAFTLAFLGAAATSALAQDAIPDLKAHGRERASRSYSAPIPIIPVRKPLPTRRACATSRRLTSWMAKRACLGSLVVHGRQYPRAVRVGDCERQQDDRRRRYGRLFSHHPHFAG